MGVDRDASQAAEVEFQAGLKRGAYIELSLSCTNVPRLDVASKSDPFCIVYAQVKPREGQQCPEWRRIGQTETVFDANEATWTQKFPAKADDGSIYRFDCYDRDSPREVLADHDFIGSAKGIRLVDILQAKGKLLDIPLRRKSETKNYGNLQICADAIVVKTPNYAVQLQVACDSKERSKFFYQLCRKMPHGGFHPVYRSELLDKKESYFDAASLKISSLCASNLHRPMRLELFKFFPMGRSGRVGFVEFCFDDFERQSRWKWQKTKTGEAAKLLVESADLPGSPDTRVHRFTIKYT